MSYSVMYLRDKNGQNVGCLAMDDSDGVYVDYQYSVLNPTDIFNRDVARQLAVGRLVEKPLTLRVGGHVTRHDVAVMVMRAIKRNSQVPSRARDAASLWLRNNTQSTAKR